MAGHSVAHCLISGNGKPATALPFQIFDPVGIFGDISSIKFVALSCAMFTRAEASLIKQEFWTTFGKYMSPVPSSEGIKINWVNYHTKTKDVYFRMHTGPKHATISIAIEHADPDIREMYFEQFLELRDLLHASLQEEWSWQLHAVSDDGKVTTRIFKELPNTSVLNKNDWPALISFFKTRIIALDEFWENARYSFDALH